MAQSINTSYAVIALGDEGTIRHFDLAVRAAQQGAVVTETYGFESGEPAAHEDLTEVEAVVTALSRAIATHTDIWMPFPMDDLGREQHVRRVSLVLQRHGLNMLMGHDLQPCTMDGGFSPIDFALRMEVKAVDELGFAALASAGMRTLGAEIEVELTHAGRPGAPAEQHVRRVSLVLQRHGLNMLMGHDLQPCTMDGGFSPIDFALRMEVKAVDELGFAALASAGMRTLGAEIEVELTHAGRPGAPAAPTLCEPVGDDVDGGKSYSATEAAKFFGRPVQWIYAGLRSGLFTHLDGSRIQPLQVGKGKRRRFTLAMLRSMALSSHLKGVVAEDELLDLLAVLDRAEQE